MIDRQSLMGKGDELPLGPCRRFTVAQTQREQLVALAFCLGLHRTKKNFLIIVFEPLLKDRHDIHH